MSHFLSTANSAVDHQYQSCLDTPKSTGSFEISEFYRRNNSMNGDFALDARNFPPLPEPQKIIRGLGQSGGGGVQSKETFSGGGTRRNVQHIMNDDVSKLLASSGSSSPASHVVHQYIYAEMKGGLSLYQKFDQNIFIPRPLGQVSSNSDAFNYCSKSVAGINSTMKSQEAIPGVNGRGGNNRVVDLNMERRAVGNGRPMPRVSLGNSMPFQSHATGQGQYVYSPPLKHNEPTTGSPHHHHHSLAQFAVNQHFNSVTIAPAKLATVSSSTQTESQCLNNMYDVEMCDRYFNQKSKGGVYQLWFVPDTSLMTQSTNALFDSYDQLQDPQLWPYSNELAQHQPWDLSTYSTNNNTEINLCNTFNTQVSLNGNRNGLNGSCTPRIHQIYNTASRGSTSSMLPNYNYAAMPSEISNANMVNGRSRQALTNGINHVNNNNQYQAQNQIKTKFDPEQERTWKSVMSALGIGDSLPMNQQKKVTQEVVGYQKSGESVGRNANGNFPATGMNRHYYPKKLRSANDFKSNGQGFRNRRSVKPVAWGGGTLQSQPCSQQPCYSEKIFIGGLQPEITKSDLRKGFQKFEVVEVAWCSRESGLIHGCAYVTLHGKHQVERLIHACRPVGSENAVCKGRKLQYDMPYCGRSIKVDIILWDTQQGTYFNDRIEAGQLYDEKYSVFVGNLHGLITAQELAKMFIDQGFIDVKSVHITTDKLNYPTGFAKVVFTSFQTFVFAVKTKKLIVETKEVNHRYLQLEPYIEGNKCCCCSVYHATIFCKNDDCLQYYCHDCFSKVHANGALQYHNEYIVRDRRVKNQFES